jgi:hypothetical protein
MIRHGVNGFLAPFHEEAERQAAALAETLDAALDTLGRDPGGLDLETGAESWSLDAVCRAHEALLAD